MVKTLAVVLAVILVVAAMAGSFYIVRAQEQQSTTSLGVAQEGSEDPAAKITVSNDTVQAGSTVKVSGKNFDASSQISVYFMSALQANFTSSDRSALILQQVAANNNRNTNAPNTNSNGNATTSTTVASSNLKGHMLVMVSNKVANGTISIECSNNKIAQGSINNTRLVNLAAEPGTYSDCAIALTEQNSTDSANVSNMVVVAIANPNRGYEDSKIGSAKANAQGSFAKSVTIPATAKSGDYAILATVGNIIDNINNAAATSMSAVAKISIIPQPTTTISTANSNITKPTITTNATATAAQQNITNGTTANNNTTAENMTITPRTSMKNLTTIAPTTNSSVSQNQTENGTITSTTIPSTAEGGNKTSGINGTAATRASVQVGEQNARQGSPLTVSGQGFAPNQPVQVFINNVQITNVVTNVEGSFNTIVIVPTTVNSGSANIVVKAEQTNISKNVNILTPLPEEQNIGPSAVHFTAVSAANKAQVLNGAPVTIFDTSNGRIVGSGKTPMDIELDAGVYSIFYSNFKNFKFASAQPGSWTNIPNGGSGLVTVTEGKNTTVAAMYTQIPPTPKPSITPTINNSLILRSTDINGNPITGMFVTVYDANTGQTIEQGFTEDRLDHLKPGTYPIFFANFGQLAFVSASPGNWVQTPFGGAGLVTIPDDGSNHSIVVSAKYERIPTPQPPQFRIQAPLDIAGQIFSITSNHTEPEEGPLIMSGSFAVKVDNEQNPLSANLTAYFMSVRGDSNNNVQLDSQSSRNHETFQIVDFKPQTSRPIGPNSYLLSGTADLLLNGNKYSNNEAINVLMSGGKNLTPTNVEIQFQGHENNSAANQLEMLYGIVTSGFK